MWRAVSFSLLCLASGAQAASCAQPGKDGAGGTLSGVINTYYPPASSGTLASGSTAVTLGTPSGAASSITPGDLLLIVQVQGATINSANSTAYGSGGSAAQGLTALTAGVYEYVKATSTLASGSSGSVSFTPALSNAYTNANSTATATGGQGQSRYQIIRVPQYSSASLSSTLTALPWNGTLGGVLALDVAGALNLNSATVNMDGKGFRGGGAVLAALVTYGLTDYVRDTLSPASASLGASKGEGVAGTPRFVANPGGTVVNGVSSLDLGSTYRGYPGGDYTRGAPGNAGGGGGQHNAGGGGGSNGGSGGTGGKSYSGDSSRAMGGIGGASLSGSVTAARVVLGGGGGAGETNNANDYSSIAQSGGGAGGGLILLRTGSLSGSGTLSVNGLSGQDAGRDAAGGGGAGGSVVALVQGSGLAGLSVSANGGNGGNSDAAQFGKSEQEGPGGGGGGGVVISSASLALSTSLSGGANGINTRGTGDAYASTSGGSSSASAGASFTAPTGAAGGAVCVPDLTLTKTTPALAARPGQNVTYTLTVSNKAGVADAQNVTLTDPLPSGMGYVSSSNAGAVSGSSVDWTGLGTLASGSSLSVTLTLSAPPESAVRAGTLISTNTATAATASYETDTSNNSGSVSVPMLLGELVKTVRNVTAGSAASTSSSGNPGDQLEYCVIMRNLGGIALTNFVLSDPLPANVSALKGAYAAGKGISLTRGGSGAQASATITGGTISLLKSNGADGLGGSLTTSGSANGQGQLSVTLPATSPLAVGETAQTCFRASVN